MLSQTKEKIESVRLSGNKQSHSHVVGRSINHPTGHLGKIWEIFWIYVLFKVAILFWGKYLHDLATSYAA